MDQHQSMLSETDQPLFQSKKVRQCGSPAIEARLGIPSIGTVVSIDLTQRPTIFASI